MDRELERKAPEHIPEEQLEAYTLGSLSSNETAFVEEHLLFCATCQDQLEAVDCYARAMQGAAKRIREEQAGAQFLPGFLDRVPAWIHSPVPMWTGAMAMIAVILMVGLHLRQSPGAAVEIQLQSVRGASSGTAPAGHALRLRLDSRGVPDNPSWRIEIVDEDGSRIWTGTGNVGAPGSTGVPAITADVNQSFKPGTYFVRLLKEGEDPVREYQLVIQKAAP